nr:SWI/SNF-related matrix-associated actin-dependent regulator of chromatin subfamily E member 1-related-like isoform X2 [Cavia porcellus]
MQRDGGQAAEPLFLPPGSAGDLFRGSSVIWTHSRNLASLPVQPDTMADPGDTKEQDTEEPKKRKGGWPKGKKRKPSRDLSVPRAPTTGYVIFLNEQRSQLQAEHPDLPFTEITKLLATQWAQLPQERKQRYIYQADEDKQRYIRELQAYQSSEAYRAFLRRRAAHEALCGTPGDAVESEQLDFSAIDGTGDGDLHCRTCHQCFSSRHNKREHLLGRQHLHNLTGEFEKDSAEYLRHLEPPEEEESQDLHPAESEEEAEGASVLGLGALAPGKSFASLDLRFWQEFIWKLLNMKEFELGELRSTLERAQAEQEALQRQLAEFQSQQQRLEVELAGLRTCGLVLQKELENLNLLLLLSCFGLQAADTVVTLGTLGTGGMPGGAGCHPGVLL